jgi:CRP-like cAMP-binding protein
MRANVSVGAKHSGCKSLALTNNLSTGMLRPYKIGMPSDFHCFLTCKHKLVSIMSVTSLFSLRPSETSKHLFTRRSLLPNSQLFLWQIETGAVRTLTWLEDGTVVHLGIWGPGDVVGKIMSKCEPYQIECLTKVEAIALPTETWFNARDILLEHLQQAEDFMVIRGYRKVDAMLYHLLAWLGKKFGSQVKHGQLINL